MPTAPAAVPREGVDRGDQVQTIFSQIAPRYDLLNHLLSLNIDRGWRRKAIDTVGWEDAPAGTFLDACAGTLDLSLELTGRSAFTGRVVAADFARPMLVHGVPKISGAPIVLICGDSLSLPFPDGSFDGATVGFGMRNLSDVRQGLVELRRVLKPGRRVVVLEFTVPPNPLMRAGYLFYFHRILPLVGRVVSGHPWAYTYLPESVRGFPGPTDFRDMFEEVGFGAVGFSLLTGGIAALHWGSA